MGANELLMLEARVVVAPIQTDQSHEPHGRAATSSESQRRATSDFMSTTKLIPGWEKLKKSVPNRCQIGAKIAPSRGITEVPSVTLRDAYNRCGRWTW